jgi:hypothetical protein
MPLIKLQFKPGVNRDQTNYTGEGGWWDIDKVRFFSGFPQKLGGWQAYTSTPILGTCRQMWGWVTTFSDNFLALGTNEKVYIETGGNLNDITPLVETTAAGDVTFAATAGSSVITVTDTGFPSDVGNYVTFSGVNANGLGVGGNITQAVLQQNYKIASVLGGNSYTIIAKNPTTGAPVLANASDSGNGGATVVGAYEITVGNAGGTYGYGWGVGGWSRGGWGSGTSQPIVLPQRDWWFDNFDNDLVMNIRNGPIYYWERGALTDPSIALATRAELLSEFVDALSDPDYDPNAVPVKAMQVLVSQNDKHLLAIGAVPYGSTSEDDFDPLLIRWASQDDPLQWTPRPTNSAGSLRISRGSRIVRALATRQEILVWTEAQLYSLQFLGTTDVFGLQEYADNISIIAPRAVASANNVTYWMGQDKFYAYSGRVETLPCTVRQYVFEDLNYEQAAQIVCGTNEGFNEVWWFYPSSESSTNDRYVVFNHLEKVWYYGQLSRTAWLDSPLRSHPQAVATDLVSQQGTVYNHELGVDADGTPMESFILSNDFDLDNGDRFVLTKRVIPDVNFTKSNTQNPEVTLKILSRNFPGSAFNTSNDDTARVITTAVNAYTPQVFMRVRARQIAFRIESDTLGTQWQLGSPRLDGRPDGER